ncbi:MAG: AAA family ATPase [Deltaproteobacteria bacterium]
MERGLERLRKIREELKAEFFERDDLIEGSLCALLSGSHLLVIGPPGTAKSELAHEICQRIEGANYFQWLLTKFTTPEEIFGALSLKSLENDEYRRVTHNKLPEAHIAFLDEVFKSSSSILNTMLTVMNERVFFNGSGALEVPLIALFGASNELPSEEDGLEALFDRFLLRYFVDYIREDFRFLKMIQSDESHPQRTRITLGELYQCRAAVQMVEVPPYLLKLIARIRGELRKKGIQLSDRRYKQSILLLKARAYLDGRGKAGESDILALENVLWRNPDERGEIQSVIYQSLHGYKERLRELVIQSRELDAYAKRKWDNEEMFIKANIEAQTKLRHIISKVDLLIQECRDREKFPEEITEVKNRMEELQKDILNTLLPETKDLT